MPIKEGRKIQMYNPCSENWDNMLVNEKGKYCESCKTAVVDFPVVSSLVISDAE